MRRLLTVALSPLLVLVLVPAAAVADWSGPRRMDATGWTAADVVSVAMARNGGAVMAWAGTPPDAGSAAELRVRRISKSGALGTVRTLSSGAALDPGHVSVAVDDDGDALLAWSAYDQANQDWQVWARRLSKDGVAGPQVRLSETTVSSWNPEAALTPGGKGAVVFDVGGQQQLRRFSLASKPGKRIPITKAGGFLGRLVATRDGDFVTAGTDGDSDVRAHRLFPDGRLLTRKISSASATTENLVDIGVDRDGMAYLTYNAVDNDGHRALWARTWRRGGALGTAHRIAPSAHVVVRATSRTDLRGDTMVTWSHQAPGTYVPVLYGRIWRYNGTLGDVHKLGLIQPADHNAMIPSPAPQLAVDDDGDGVVSWPSEPDTGKVVTWARRVHRDGTVGPRVQIRDGARPHTLAMTPGGRARLGFTTTPGALMLRTGP